MKKLLVIVFLLTGFSAGAQYYLRGEVRDEANNPVSNAKMMVHSSGYLYYSGNGGAFGISLPRSTDSITFSADGFYGASLSVNASLFQTIVLKPRFAPVPKAENRLMSLTRNLTGEELKRWTVAAETYSSLVENEFVNTRKYPETGFAININKASYSNIRRFLNMDNSVPPDAVRVEEMLNYFNFGYTQPLEDSAFSYRSAVAPCPWNGGNRLLFLNVCARKANMDSIPPANLVFLVDVSGSMDLPNRLPLLKSAFRLLVNNLRDRDTVSIVVYGGVNGVWLTPTSGQNKKKILESISELEPGGATPGEAGIRSAYRLAKSQYVKGGTNRVILATDGDFNVGQQSDDELNQLIYTYRKEDIYLTCLGVGMGNYKDSKLEVLAGRGKGNFAYLDNEKEAEKVLMNEFAQTIYAVARDAYIDIDFDPAFVKNYRLIGFDNKLNALSDSSRQLQGGEIGSGHSLMAVFELEPARSGMDSMLMKPDFAQMHLHYTDTRNGEVKQELFTVPYRYQSYNTLPKYYRFAASVAWFGSLLKNSPYTEKSSWDELYRTAIESEDPADVSQQEYVQLLDKARRIYHRNRKKKKWLESN